MFTRSAPVVPGIVCAAVIALMVAGAACSKAPQVAPAGQEPAAAPAPAANEETASVDRAQLYEKACSTCHTLDKVKEHAGEHPWPEIVQMMIEKGAKISAEEAKLIIAHLEETYPATQ